MNLGRIGARGYTSCSEVLGAVLSAAALTGLMGLARSMTKGPTSRRNLPATLCDNTDQGLCAFDKKGRLLYSNKMFGKLTGLSEKDLGRKKTWPNMLRHLDNHEGWKRVSAILVNGRGGTSFRLRRPHRVFLTGHARWISADVCLVTIVDVSALEREREDELFFARHDCLTNRYNRHAFNEYVDDAIFDSKVFSVLFLDLDKFKEVNDLYGHKYGDLLLRQFSDRLVSCTREDDIVARLGGDEFGILILGGAERSRTLAERIVKETATPFIVEGQTFRIGTCIGIAVGPEHGRDFSTIIRHADMALYEAKSSGRATWRMFREELGVLKDRDLLLRQEISQALPNGELNIVYHPVCRTGSRDIQSLEAVVQWNRPDGEVVAIADLLEQTNDRVCANELTRWMLARVCSDAASSAMPLPVSVKLSRLQIRDSELPRFTETTLREFGISPERLEIEILESVYLNANPTTLTNLMDLRKLGLKIIVSDFGKAAITYKLIEDFKPDKIKLHQSIVSGLFGEDGGNFLSKFLMPIASVFGIEVVARDVRTEEHVDRLGKAGVTHVQGDVLSLQQRLDVTV